MAGSRSFFRCGLHHQHIRLQGIVNSRKRVGDRDGHGLRGYVATAAILHDMKLKAASASTSSTSLRLGNQLSVGVKSIERKLSTSTAPPTMRIPRYRRPKKLNPTIRTLRPDLIISQGEKVHDLSGVNGPLVISADRKRRSQQNYGRGETKLLPFPPNTRGYFYYHRSPGRSELASSIRFRLCEGPEDFERGCDLLAPSGQPWGHSLLEIAAHPCLEVFSELVLAEGLVDQKIISDLAKLNSHREQDRSPFLFSLAEPFFYNVAFVKRNVRILTRKKIIKVDLKMHSFAQHKAGPKYKWITPLTGLVKLQFEISTLPEHVPLGPTLVLRVLEVVEPITMDPNYAGAAVVPPQLGTLVYRMRYGKKHIVHLPISRQKMSADILQLAKNTWPDAII